MPRADDFPRALDAPPTAATPLTAAMMDEALTHSRRSPRGRIILPLHKDAAATLHRMLNAMQPGTYVRPHRHGDPPKAESFVLLRGAMRVVVFDGEGGVTGWTDLAPGGATFGMDVEPGVFHTMIALAPDTVMFEVKPGPYTPASDKDFAPWAPEEGAPEAATYLDDLLTRTTRVSGPGA